MKLDYNKTQQFLSQKFAGSQAFLDNILSPIFSNYEWVSSENRSELDEEEELRPLAEQIGIEEVLQVGYFEHEEEIEPFYLFDITVRDSVQMSRNRVGVQRIIRRILDDFSHAFMLFHYEDTDRWDWRFSYCHKGGTNEVDSDAKRYTYLLGPGQTCRTATQRFVDLSKNETLSLKAIQDAFNVEALSDEFFNKYREHYADIVQYITGKRYVKQSGKWVEKKLNEPCEEIYSQFRDNFAAPDKTVRDYIKKLMGRLVFLQFLQKKGWLGVPADRTDWIGGDPEFLQNSWNNYEDKVHFIDNFLEPLFSDLDTKRKNDIASKAVGAGIKIPYLNGGLFELDQEDVIEMPMPEEYIGGILQFFSEYNFTIDENDPNDAQVGVDPEMLGRIFENLLEDNKDKGAYYTPKPIVKYMCTESLIAYLKTGLEDNEKAIRDFVKEHEVESLPTEIREKIRQKLRNIKICDPAIGSGAFPVGLLNELFLCLGALETFKNPAEIKKHIIQNSIYGVDIEKGAVDIARLRFWLSIVVDEPTPETLPNLDFKIMQGNSLLEQYQGYDLSKLTSLDTIIEMADGKPVSTTLFGSEVDTKRIELRNLLKEYYSLSDKYEKDHKRDEIKVCVEEQLKADNTNLNLQDIDVAGNDQFFLWHTWFSDVFNRPSGCSGFDIVIGNPPYVKEYVNRHAFDGFRETSPYYMGKMDLWYGFACHGLDLLCKKGHLCFIAQNNWTTSAGAKKMRKKIVEDALILQMLDFNTYMVFENADIQTMIMLFEKNQDANNYEIDYRIMAEDATKEDMLALLNKKTCRNKYKIQKFSRTKFANKLFTFSENDLLFEKISEDKVYLQDDEVAQGIVFPQDFLDKKGAAKLENRYPMGSGIFGLSFDEKEKLNLSDNEKSIIKPYFTTEQILRYYTIPSNSKWLIYTDSSFKSANSMDNYPHIKAHLDQFIDIFTSDNKPYGLHRSRKEKFFQGEKIISLRKCVERPCFSYSDFDCYVAQTFFSIKSTRWNMKFLTGVLNSRLVAFWLRHKGKMQGSNYQVDKEPLQGIPLPLIDLSLQQPIIDLVDAILTKKKQSPQADILDLENSIDYLVYSLYRLSEDDIKIVESN